MYGMVQKLKYQTHKLNSSFSVPRQCTSLDFLIYSEPEMEKTAAAFDDMHCNSDRWWWTMWNYCFPKTFYNWGSLLPDLPPALQ